MRQQLRNICKSKKISWFEYIIINCIYNVLFKINIANHKMIGDKNR